MATHKEASKAMADALNPKIKFEIGKHYESYDFEKFLCVGFTTNDLVILERTSRIKNVIGEYSTKIYRFDKNGYEVNQKYKIASLYAEKKKMYAYLVFKKDRRQLLGNVEWSADLKYAVSFSRVENLDYEAGNDAIVFAQDLFQSGCAVKKKKKPVTVCGDCNRSRCVCDEDKDDEW